ncbi:MAG TPA: glycosyltransferase, partial [Candidatus Saccharimonadales bacterium]|nr:glycosyltransferase [Candidatus Saccharimonadales bacterium]
MRLIYRIEELIKKTLLILRKKGFKETARKIRIFLTRDLFGRNFSLVLSHGSYRYLWQRVFDSYKTKGFFVFAFRFVLTALFGWVVLFITPKVIDFVPEKKILSWYSKNKRKVSIIIPTYNDFSLTKACIDSIKQTTDLNFVEIVVSDDGSEKKIQDQLKDLNVKLVLSKQNGGYAKAVNLGFSKTQNTDVILLNNDTLVKKGWLEAMQYWAYSNEAIGIVGPKLIYPDQTIQWAGTYRNDLEPQWFDHYFRNQPADLPSSEVSYPVLAATGACMYIKRTVIDKIGILDEGYQMAFEDVDYSLKAWEAGFRVVYCPKALVVHYESKTRGRTQGSRELASRDYFWSKWKNFFEKRNVLSKNGKLRIVYVNQDNGVGGGTRVIFEHLNRLSRRGHEVSLYSITPPPDWFELEVPVKVFKDYEQLIEDLKEIEAIKIATWWETSEAVWLSSVLKGIPAFLVQDIETSYYSNEEDYKNKVLASYRKEFTYLTVSNWDREELDKLAIDAAVINPGVSEIFYEDKKTKKETQLLAIGRSNPLKNFDLTAKAIKLLKSKPKVKLFGI